MSINKYRLIKEYPGSPKLGTLAEVIKNTVMYTETDNDMVFYRTDSINFKKHPEYWEEIVEKEYEILEIVNIQSYLPNELKNLDYSGDITAPPNTIFKLNNPKTEFDSPYCSSPLNYDTSIFSIWKIKRLSDGEVFTVGDKIKGYKNTGIKEICIYPYGLRIITDANGEGCVTDELSWNLENCIKLKQPLFTTEDGVDVYEGDKYFQLAVSFSPNFREAIYEEVGKSNIIYLYGLEEGREGLNKHGRYYFSTKEAAEEYVLMIKPCLSAKDILKRFNSRWSEVNETTLKELVKSKI